MHVPQTEIILSHEGTEFAHLTLPPGEYVIGRAAGVEILADTPLVSPHHARLTLNYDDILLEDLGSSDGTFVADRPLTEPTRVFPNQAVRVGGLTLEIRRQRVASDLGVSLVPVQATLQRILPAELLGDKRYAIGQQIAQGGMGAILDAREVPMKRQVAMKVMLYATDEAEVLRFIEEAQVTGQLDHPNIVPIHELGVNEHGQPFYTMKMVRGVTLKKALALLADGDADSVKKYPLPALLTIFQKACDAVAFAHARGVIHRDLKPENIMLGDFGSVLVMDWGLAKVVGQKASLVAVPSARTFIGSARQESGDLGSTMSGTILGTPQYMSPEQARGEVETLDARSDVFALGTILFELLHLRPIVAGMEPMTIVEQVGRGEIDWTPPAKAVPAALLAVCRKALAFDRQQRYASVEDLQRDLAAYQAGFATSAENAGAWRQITLLVKRHRTAAAGLAAVLLVGGVLGTKAMIEGRRAARGEARANAALADLKKSAPALLQLAESEADAQRFESALEKLDAALALDPALARARWQRGWVLLALERWSDATEALRLARQHDPEHAQLATILPAVEQVAAASPSERWKTDPARAVYAHLQTAGATGPALAFSSKLKLPAAERRRLVDQRLLATFGKGNYRFLGGSDGLVNVILTNGPVHSLEPLRGLPVDSLDVSQTLVTDLEPLRGLRLQNFSAYRTGVTDLSPLAGMPLRWIQVGNTAVRELSPLKGMPLLHSLYLGPGKQLTDLSPLAGLRLKEIDLHGTGVARLDALRGMPLTKVVAALCANIKDCSPLQGAPLETLDLQATKVSDLSFLAGMPLRTLDLGETAVTNLAPLRGLPLVTLSLWNTAITDLSPLAGGALKTLNIGRCIKLADFTPVLSMSHLESLRCDVLPAALAPLRERKTLRSIEADAYSWEGHQGARPVAEFWAAYDAHQAANPAAR